MIELRRPAKLEVWASLKAPRRTMANARNARPKRVGLRRVWRPARSPVGPGDRFPESESACCCDLRAQRRAMVPTAATPARWLRRARDIVVVLIALQGPHDVAQRGLNGLSPGSIYALGAVGLTLVYGILKLVNFAHGDFLTFGAYMAYVVNVTWGCRWCSASCSRC